MLLSGTLPLDLSFSTGGALSGIPSAPGTSNFTLKATDNNGCMGMQDYSITISVGCTGPMIVTHPAAQTVCAPTQASFSVIASGTAPFTYQWRKGGVNIGGATNSTFTINPTSAADAGNYDVIVTGACGSTTSNTATLTLNTAPAVTIHPANQTVCAGGNASFTVAASGAPTPTVHWQESTDGGVNFSPLAGQTNTTLTLNGVAAAMNNRRYRAVFTNLCGTATSNAATLTVSTSPSITTQPQNQTVCAGSPATFSVVANGTGPLTYQWRKNGTAVPGATNSTFTINPTATSDAGNYDVVITGACGAVTSAGATLTVNLAPGVTTQPSNQAVCPNGTATFTAAATALPAATVQWQQSTDGGANFSDLPGATNATLTLPNVNAAMNNHRYRAVFTNTCGSANSAAATLTVHGFSIAPLTRNFPFTGGSDSITVTVGGACTWTALSNAPWITINSGSSGSGNGTVSYAVAPNSGGQRSGTITAAGQTHTVTQDANNGLVFHPLPRPLRLLDTRPGGNCDNISVPIVAGTSLATQARVTCEGVTIPATAQAIVGNLTVINQTASFGFLTIFPTGQSLPLAANMIYGPGGVLSNYFTVSLSAGGQFNIFGERTIHAVVDVAGYYSAEASDVNGAGLLFHPLPRPLRLLDTRPGGNCDNLTTPIAAETALTTQARVTCEGITIPAAAQTIIGNVTALNLTPQFGFLTVYPNKQPLPLAANMVYAPGDILSNAFFVGLSASGEFNIFGERTIHAVVDVAGYFAP